MEKHLLENMSIRLSVEDALAIKTRKKEGKKSNAYIIGVAWEMRMRTGDQASHGVWGHGKACKVVTKQVRRVQYEKMVL